MDGVPTTLPMKSTNRERYQQLAGSTGVDSRFILAIMMQEKQGA